MGAAPRLLLYTVSPTRCTHPPVLSADRFNRMASQSPPASPTFHSLLPATTGSPEETTALGASIASRLGGGAVLALYGDLGTGKTRFVKGVAEGLDIRAGRVRSPTFTVVCTYEDGHRPLYHFDAYRVQTSDEFVELGFEEYVYGDGITCIEWAGRVASLLPPSTIHLSFTHVSPNERRITQTKTPPDATP